MTIRSVVLGCGSYLPQRILTNAELATRIDTSDEWIVQRTGIRQRHIAADGEFTSHLAINAARAALADADIDAPSRHARAIDDKAVADDQIVIVRLGVHSRFPCRLSHGRLTWAAGRA